MLPAFNVAWPPITTHFDGMASNAPHFPFAWPLFEIIKRSGYVLKLLPFVAICRNAEMSTSRKRNSDVLDGIAPNLNPRKC